MARHARRANALICQRGTAHRRRRARRSSVFGNALGNAAYQGLSNWQAAQAAASTPAGIPIGNADISQQIAQDIGTPSVNVPNLAQNPSLDFSGFSGGTTTVGSAGAQGWWGMAQQVLGANASNAAIEQWVQAAISANNGQTVLQQGQVVNLPGRDEIVTDAAKLSYDAANASYQVAQATANAQSEAALWGTIAGIGQEQSLQQMMDLAPVAPQPVTPTATTPPPVENWYTPRGSPIEALNNSAEALAANPQASWGDRLLGAVLGAATTQAATVDSMISGFYNLPNNVNLGGQYLARASTDQGWENKSIDYLQGGNLLLQSFATMLGVAAPIESAGSSLFEVPSTTVDAAAGPVITAPPGYQILYRGTATPTTQFLSDVAATQGVDASNAMIANAENEGSVSYLFENHAATSQGSPYISLSSSEEVAQFFARGPDGNQSGFVSVFQVPDNFARPNFENANAWEREYLAPTQIPDQYMIYQYQVTPQGTP